MPSKSDTSKRKANAPASADTNKAARTGNSRDAPTSKRQGLCPASLGYFCISCFFIAPANELITDKGTEKGKYFHPYCKS